MPCSNCLESEPTRKLVLGVHLSGHGHQAGDEYPLSDLFHGGCLVQKVIESEVTPAHVLSAIGFSALSWTAIEPLNGGTTAITTTTAW